MTIVGAVVAPSTPAPAGDLVARIFCRMLLLGAQALVVSSLTGGRRFLLTVVLQMIADLTPGQPSAVQRGWYGLNVILMVAGLQFIWWSSYHLWREHAPSSPTPRRRVLRYSGGRLSSGRHPRAASVA
jgi:hypothetical protein